MKLHFTLPGCASARILLTALALTLAMHAFPAGKEYYQIRIYRLGMQGQEKMMDLYLRDAFIPALKRAGIERVGVFKPINAEDSLLMVLVPFASLEQFGNLEGLLEKDPKYRESAADFLTASHDRPPYNRMESILLEAFDEMPFLAVPDHPTPKKERVYELRSYEGPTEAYYHRKVEMFNEGGETALFQKLGFQPVFFGSVISGNHMPNLMYMTTFKDATSQEKCWDAFRVHPGWTAIKDLEQYRNTVSHIDRFLLYPAEYSGL